MFLWRNKEKYQHFLVEKQQLCFEFWYSDKHVWANSVDRDETAPKDQGLHFWPFNQHLFEQVSR